MQNISAALILGTAVVACSEPAAVEPDAPRAPDASCQESSRIVFMNRYGGTYTDGPDDSVANTTPSAKTKTVLVIPPWNGDDAEWEMVVSCVRNTFAPFNVSVVESDPGAVDHQEIVVGGTAEDIGGSGGAPVGVTASSCEAQPRNIAFILVEDLDGVDAAWVCRNAAYFVGYALGLVPVRSSGTCPDLMSFDQCVAPPTITDNNLQCADDGTSCECGDQRTQNSYQRILAAVGPRCPT